MVFSNVSSALRLGIALFFIGQLPASADTTNIDTTATSTGGYWFNCGIRSNTTVGCWGTNLLGQMGDGNWFTRALRPVTPTGLGRNVIEVGTGAFHSCALKSNGRMYCWGQNTKGQLGQGTFGGGSLTPVEVPLPARAVDIAVGHEHTCAALRNGRVACWGWNANGQLGIGTLFDQGAPVLVEGLRNVVAVETHYRHTCALHSNQTVSCFGSNVSGQSSVNDTASELVPVRVDGVRNVVELGLGQDHTCARQDSGAVLCWGNNVFRQLGRETVNSAPNGPGRVSRLGNATKLGVGRFHSCAADATGKAFCWGYNYDGQIGNGEADKSAYSNVPVPTRVKGLGRVHIVSVHAGYDHSCALDQEGTMRCWGANSEGQLGDGTRDASLKPVRVKGARFLVPGDVE